MINRRRSVCGWLGVVAAGGLGFSPAASTAQFPVASGPPLVMNPPVVESAPIVTSVAPATGNQRIRYRLPLFSNTRQEARMANRYTVARPVYAGRPGVSFAPYSDYYFPRVIGSKETVYTAAPNAPAPVGYRAFARPGTPVFPR